MKTLVTIITICLVIPSLAQPNRKARMAPVYEKGYYVNNKNDTVWGQVQVNPEDPSSFYSQFSFLSGKSKKPKVMLPAQARYYGYGEHHFVMLNTDGEKIYGERLTDGRLRMYEVRHEGKVDGHDAIVSDYYIRDAYASADQVQLKEPKKIPQKFYKKALKPYLRDQPMLWTDLDKYNFEPQQVVRTIREFNQFYASTAN